MTESYHWDEPFYDIEAMLREASEYVRASDDLRPRVLEAARQQHGEQRAQRCIRHVAMFVLLLAFFTAADWHGLDDQRSRPIGRLLATRFDEVFSSAVGTSTRNGDGDWRMIEAFTELRRQQAQVLRLSI